MDKLKEVPQAKQNKREKQILPPKTHQNKTLKDFKISEFHNI
jgi:hypothetical protein